MKTDKELWVAARVDELKCDNLWCIKMSEEFSKSWIADFDEFMNLKAKQAAEREHSAIVRAVAAIGEKL